ncbi:MAG: heavy-metal-associated protein [Chitinophagaceae bacterium]|nr:heavy-metal-associated protein [Chitinophagaceae bacterium]
MKKGIVFLLLLMVGFIPKAQFMKATLQASGLTCAMCNNAINKALKGLPFISSVKSDIKNASFDIEFKEKTEVNIDAMRKTVEDAGFFVAKLKLTGNFDNVNVKNDEHLVIGDKTFHFLEVDNQVLNGEKTLTLLDKNFLTAKEFRKMSRATKMACMQTGKMTSEKDGAVVNTRVYHVTI